MPSAVAAVQPVPNILHVPNNGREARSYLAHIVDNYDKLADWTVFSQVSSLLSLLCI